MSEKACLIIPPSPFLLDERVFPSIGILKVAASLEAQGITVDMLDLSGVANFNDVVRIYVEEHPDVRNYGITSTTPQFPSACSIAVKIGSTAQWETNIIVGGPHPTLVAAAAKGERKVGVNDGRGSKALEDMYGPFDKVIAGDGDLIKYEQMFGPGHFIDADDPKTELFMTDATYEVTPSPARHLIDMTSYHYQIEGHKATSLIGQLGCPFQCGFCGGRQSPMLRRIRTRSVSSIVNEVEQLYRDHGYTGFMFYDDELNVSKSLVEMMDELSKLQDRLKTEFRLRGFVKAELFNEEQASAMYRAGFRWLLTGFESGSPRILENINKRATRDENTRAVQLAHAAGLKVKALMSIGHPGETQQTLEDTTQWLLQVAPEDFDITIITTYPGTPYYDQAVNTAPGIWTYTAKSGDKLHAYELDYSTTADYYKGSPDGGYKAYVYTDELASDQLIEHRDMMERNVRTFLGIPFNTSVSAQNYEHSMGQALPGTLLRTTEKLPPKQRHIVKLSVVK